MGLRWGGEENEEREVRRRIWERKWIQRSMWLKSKICGWGWCVEDEVGVNRRRRGWLRRMKWG